MANIDSLIGIDPDLNVLGTGSSCSYYSVTEYVNLLQTSASSLKFINFNIRSFHSNSDHFIAFLELLPVLPDLVLLSETWNSVNNVVSCKLPNYQDYHQFRETRRGGGISVFCSMAYDSSEVSELCIINENIETCGIRIKLGNNYVVVLGVYRPPAGEVASFIDYMEELLQLNVIRRATQVVIAGDMNINLNGESSIAVSNYLSCLNSSNFIPAISKFTRFPSDLSSFTPSNLDHIWLNNLSPYISGVINYDLTDHCPTFLNLSLVLEKPVI